jgi:hypothetical protein
VKQRSRRAPRRKADLTPNARFGRSKYLSLFVRKYRPTYRQLHLKLRCELYRQLSPALNLKLDLDINPLLNRTLFAALYLKTDPSLLAPSFGAFYLKKQRSFDGPIYPQLCRRMLPTRRPGGRGVGGEIVVRNGPTTTYRCVPIAMAAHVFRPPCPAEFYNAVG